MIKLQRKNLKKHQRPITFYLIPRENKTTIILDMPLLKMAEEEEEDLATSISLAIFQISLRIFLVRVLGVVDGQESQTIEAQI